MKKIILSLFILSSFALGLTGCSGPEAIENGDTANKKTADKIIIIYFHGTQRCVSCSMLERLSRETVFEFFQPELRDGKVEFKEVNVDLPANKEIAQKYQTRGSSLFINAIYDGQENISQDTRVWRLLSNEGQFKNYLKSEINNYLGK
jgi:thiol-disulfide isomerase/thioredoxin